LKSALPRFFTGLLIFFLSSLSAHSQYFEKVYGGAKNAKGISFTIASDRGIVVLSNAYDTSFQANGYFIFKADTLGTVSWEKTFSNPFNSYGASITSLNNGKIVFLGTQTGVSFQNIAEVIELDSSGNFLDNEIFPPFNGWGTAGIALDNANDSSAIISIYNDGFISNNYYSVFSLNTDLTTKWTDFVSFDGSLHSQNALSVAPDGSVYTLAYYDNYFYSANPLFRVSSIIKHNSAGLKILDTLYEFNSPTIAMAPTFDGGVIVCGTQDTTPSYDIFLSRIDSSGNVLWNKQYGSEYKEESNAVIQTFDSGFIVLATKNDPVLPGQHDIVIMKTNAAGDSLWTRQFGGIFNENGLQLREDGTDLVIMASTTSFGEDKIYIVRTDSSGTIVSPYTITTNGTYFCEGDTAVLQVTPSLLPGLHVEWSNGDTVNPVNTHTTGTYFAVISDSAGNVIQTPTESVYFAKLPLATFANDTVSFCEGTMFIDTMSDELTNSYQWFLNDTILVDETFPFLTPIMPGSYKLVVTNYCNSDTGITFLDSLFDLPAKPVITAPAIDYVCPGDSLPLSISPVPGNIYQWFKTDNISFVDSIPGSTDTLYFAKDFGNFIVGTTNVAGCNAFSISYSVFFDHSTEFVIANGPTHFCDGGIVELSVSDGTGYQWSTGDTTQKIDVTATGSYYVSFVNDNGCFKNSDTLDISVLVNPDIFLGTDTNLCSDSSLVLDPGSGYSNYFWHDASISQTYTATSPGPYPDSSLFFVAVTDSNGCTDSDTISIIFDVCAGLQEGPLTEIRFYPNPVRQNDWLEIESAEVRFLTIVVFDLLSREVYRDQISERETIPVSLSPGIYTVSFLRKEKTIFSNKLVVY
jgi:hypothetical protein